MNLELNIAELTLILSWADATERNGGLEPEDLAITARLRDALSSTVSQDWIERTVAELEAMPGTSTHTPDGRCYPGS